MAMAPPRLLRGLIAPLSLSLSPADWLPCHQQLLTSAALLHRWWIPSLARLRCSDGFKLFLVVLLVSAALAEVRYVASASMVPTLRPGDRAVAEKLRNASLKAMYSSWVITVITAVILVPGGLFLSATFLEDT